MKMVTRYELPSRPGEFTLDLPVGAEVVELGFAVRQQRVQVPNTPPGQVAVPHAIVVQNDGNLNEQRRFALVDVNVCVPDGATYIAATAVGPHLRILFEIPSNGRDGSA